MHNERVCPVLESKKKKPDGPRVLDIIKIDERWAQIISTGNIGSSHIRFLDNGEGMNVDLNTCIVVKHWGMPLFAIEDRISMTKDEIHRVFWGPEQRQYPSLIMQVSVFGEYALENNQKDQKETE